MRWILLTTLAIISLILAFTFFYFNDNLLESTHYDKPSLSVPSSGAGGESPSENSGSILGGTSPSGITDDLAPFGSYASGTSGGLYVANIYGQGPGWIFFFDDGVDDIKYYILADEIAKGLLTIHSVLNNNPSIIPIFKGGTLYRDSNGNVQNSEQVSSRVSLINSFSDEFSLTLVFAENDLLRNTKTYKFTIKGKTLVMDISADSSINSYNNNYAGFSLGTISGFQQKNTFINYMKYAPVNSVLDSNDNPIYFYTLYMDQTQTNGQWFNLIGCDDQNDGDTCYLRYDYAPRKNNQEAIPLKERIYLTVSSNVDDVMVKINNPPSPYLSNVKSKTYIDIYDENFVSVFNKDAIVLQWTAQSSGQVKMQTATQRYNSCLWTALIPGVQSGGSVLEIKKGESIIRTEAFSGADKLLRQFNDTFSVVQGDKIRFELSTKLNNFCEELRIWSTISLNGNEYHYPESYNNVQSSGGWEYLISERGVDSLLNYDYALDRWQTTEYRSYISRDGMSPPYYNTFFMTADFVDELYSLGIDDFVFFFGRHGKNGWDVTFPELYPSTFVKGGDQGILALGNAVKRYGSNSLFTLYYINNWLSLRFPDVSIDYYSRYGSAARKNQDGTIYINPYWSNIPSFGYCPGGIDICLNSPPWPVKLTCPFSRTCYMAGNGAGSFTVVDYGKIAKPYNGYPPFANIDTIEAKQQYGLTAGYTDAFLGNPSYTINYFDDDSTTKTISGVITASRDVLNYLKKIYDGPMDSEGWGDISLGMEYRAEMRQDVLAAGYVDSMLFPPDFYPRSKIPLIPDFAHKSINPLMVPHGPGFRDRTYKIFLGQPSLTKESDYEYDGYRALLLAYGFANYLSGDVFTQTPFDSYSSVINNMVKEYYIVKAMQTEYLAQGVTITKILYNDHGQLVDLSNAIKQRVNFYDDQIYLEYNNGFRIYINYDRNNNWIIHNTPKGSITLPTYGFVAWKPNGMFAANYIVDGHKVDYVESSGYTLRDGRGTSTTFPDNKVSKYLDIKLSSGDSVFCEKLYGCYRNYVGIPPSGLLTVPSDLSLLENSRFKIVGLDIHPDAKLYYNGDKIDQRYFKVVDSKTIEVYSEGQFNQGILLLQVTNPGDNGAFISEITGGSSSGSSSSSSTGGSVPQGKTISINLDNFNTSVFNLTKQDTLKIIYNKTNYSLVLDSIFLDTINLKLLPGIRTIPLILKIWRDINLDSLDGSDVKVRVNEIYGTSKVNIAIESLVPVNGTLIGGNVTDEDENIEDLIKNKVVIRVVFWIVSVLLVLGIVFASTIILRLLKKRINYHKTLMSFTPH